MICSPQRSAQGHVHASNVWSMKLALKERFHTHAQSSIHTLRLQSHTVVTRAESCWNRHGVPGSSLTTAYVSPKFQQKPPHEWYHHIYSDHPCRWHWCTPIPSQRLVFALFLGNNLDGLFHLWHVESDVKLKCGLDWPENTFPLSFGPSQMTSGSENSAFVCKVNKCLPLCKIQFQVAFLDAVADYVEWQWFSKVLPSPCDYAHHGRITFSQTIPPEGFLPLAFTHKISPHSLNLFTILWTVDGERPTLFAILRWETLSLNWLTILSRSLAQSGEPRLILACKDFYTQSW